MRLGRRTSMAWVLNLEGRRTRRIKRKFLVRRRFTTCRRCCRLRAKKKWAIGLNICLMAISARKLEMRYRRSSSLTL